MSKLSISRAWEESRAILARDGKLFAAVALALVVFPGTVSELVTPKVPPGQFPPPGAWTIVAVIALLVGLTGQLAITRMALNAGTSVAEAIRHGARRAPAYIGAVMIWILPLVLVTYALVRGTDPDQPNPAAVLGSLLLVVAAIFLFVRMILSLPVASSEAAGPLAILKRSWALTRGDWWRLFGFLIIWLIMVVVIILAIGAVVGTIVNLTLGEPEPMSLGALLVALITQLATAVVTVVFVVMVARIYAQKTVAAQAGVPEVERKD